MKKQGKKYLIKESELKEIIRETILLEERTYNWNPADFKGLYNPDGTAPRERRFKDLQGSLSALSKAVGNWIAPEDWRKMQYEKGPEAWKWLLGALGLNPQGTGARDVVPDIKSGKWFGGQGILKGNNNDGHETLNVAAAVRYILSHATPHYDPKRNGRCAAAVRAALNAGGMTTPWGMGWLAGNAAGYLTILPSNGWDEIAAAQAGNPGDIMVLEPLKASEITGTRAPKNHPDGHIAMCVGNGRWVSDFVQPNVHGIKGIPPASKMHFFRYKNLV